jgi:hypothetical protein
VYALAGVPREIVMPGFIKFLAAVAVGIDKVADQLK